MDDNQEHSRRDFLQGKAASRTFADRVVHWAQQWVESATEIITDRFPEKPTLHLTASRLAMACEFSVRYHEVDRCHTNALLEAFDEIERVESLLTIYRPDSEVTGINNSAATGPVTISSEFFGLLKLAEKLSQETNGAFDITGTPLSRVWGFTKREGRFPTPDEIAAACELVGMEKIRLNATAETIEFLSPGVEINFNALGKGYALDRVAGMLDSKGMRDYLWHGGRSSVLARGINHGDDGDCWSIGVRHPLEGDFRLAEIHLRDKALGTSGGAAQFFIHEGKQYSHILDPRTGWPASGLFTATVVAPTAAEADALSTAAFVLGPNGIAELCSRRPEIGVLLVCPTEAEYGINVVTGNLNREDWTPLCDTRMLAAL